jgi:hypothetical protein
VFLLTDEVRAVYLVLNLLGCSRCQGRWRLLPAKQLDSDED